jgi:ketosteroid isomerase-like protein
MTTIDELGRRLDRLEAELALHRLAHDYCIGADHRDLPRWESVWTDDAVWETSPDQTFTGIDAIRDAVQAQWDTFPIMQHATANHVVSVAGDSATGRCDVVVLVQLPDRQWVVGGGCYEDTYRRCADKGWRIAHRRVVRPFDLAPLSPVAGPGEVNRISG